MTKELYEALQIIGEECKKYDSCRVCSLSTDRYDGSLCLFKHLNPITISGCLVKKEVYEFDESIR